MLHLEYESYFAEGWGSALDNTHSRISQYADDNVGTEGGWPTFTFFVKVGIHAACGSGRFWEFGLGEVKIPSLRRERERLGHPAIF